MAELPPGGTPGVPDFRNPTLIPNFDVSTASGGDTVDHSSPATYLQNNPRTDATATVTVGGTPVTGDELTLVVSNPLLAGELYGYLTGGEVGLEYTVLAGDTVGTIADAIANLINGNAILQALNVRASVGGSAGAVITVRHNGPLGNFTTLSVPTIQPSTITVGGTALTGDRLAVLFSGPQFGAGVLVTTDPTTGNTTTQMATALAAAITANAALAALGISATSSLAVVSLTVPAAAEPVSLSAWVNQITPQATITGTATAGDDLNLTFANAAISGTPVTVSHAVTAGETTTQMAAGLVSAINGNAALTAAGISATNAANVLTVVYQQINGQLRISESVTGSATETIGLTATPTETLAIAPTGTETITLTPSNGKLSGGAGPVLAIGNFSWTFHSQAASFFYGTPYSLSYDILSNMVVGGAPIS